MGPWQKLGVSLFSNTAMGIGSKVSNAVEHIIVVVVINIGVSRVTTGYYGDYWLPWLLLVTMVTTGYYWLPWLLLVTTGYYWLLWLLLVTTGYHGYYGYYWLPWLLLVTMVTTGYYGYYWLLWLLLQVLAAHESAEVGVQWSNFLDDRTTGDIPFGSVILVLLFDLVLYAVLAWYVILVTMVTMVTMITMLY